MKVTWSNGQWYLKATVYPFDDFRSSIDIERSRPFGAKEGDVWPEARINWPSIGSVNREKAEIFADGLEEAIEIAYIMNQPVNIAEATFEINDEVNSKIVTAEFACTRQEQIEDTIQEEGGKLLELRKWRTA